MSFAPGHGQQVPDPYYDGSFEEVFDLLDTVCRKAMEELGGEVLSSKF